MNGSVSIISPPSSTTFKWYKLANYTPGSPAYLYTGATQALLQQEAMLLKQQMDFVFLKLILISLLRLLMHLPQTVY